ncbi:MAG: primosomal protein N', partial [Deltaproteobacteria bacterium]
LAYPPFSRLAIIRFDGNKEEEVAAFAKKTKELADSLLLRTNDVTLLGPTPAILSKLKGKYRWQMLLKGKSAKSLHEFIKNLLTGLEKKPQYRVKLAVDVDPITTI